MSRNADTGPDTTGDVEYDTKYDRYTSEGYPPDWQSRHRKVLGRDGYRCQSCGVKSTRADDVYFDVDHVVPKSDGGSHALSNLQTLCPSCHAEKHPDNDGLARRARRLERRNRTPVWRRLFRIVLVVPVLLDRFVSSDPSTDGRRVVTDEHGRELVVTPLEALPEAEEGRTVTVEARVATLWETSAESVQQTGPLAPPDSTRDEDVPLTKFVSWTDSGLGDVEENATYRIVGAETSTYEGDTELSLDGRTEIVPLG
jgi:5-methylcytosine-specific restriction endonuclease McrA